MGNIQRLVFKRNINIDNEFWTIVYRIMELPKLKKFFNNPLVLAVGIVFLTLIILEILL